MYEEKERERERENERYTLAVICIFLINVLNRYPATITRYKGAQTINAYIIQRNTLATTRRPAHASNTTSPNKHV